MTPWPTTIVKDHTADGVWVLTATTPFKIGQTVEVDLDSRRFEEFGSKKNPGTQVKTEIINLVDPENPHPPLYFPVELLDL